MFLKGYIVISIISALKLAESQFCNENEIVSPVINTCNSCGIKGWCPQEVGFGCDCYPGFLRNSLGSCVPPEECDIRPALPQETISEAYCGPNEVYSACVNPCNDCQTKNITCNFFVCNKGCDCRPGYTRNEQRICIPENLCPPGTGPQCSIPKCGPGCTIDYSSKPCPSCKCDEPGPGTGPQCSMPKCGPGCTIDYSSKPCPSCKCDEPGSGTGPQCSMPKCGPGCTIDYSSKPCPSCKCDEPGSGTGPQCSMPKCGPGCTIDYSSKPCPSCKCDEPGSDFNGPQSTQCGRNEVFKTCGTACPATCENPRPGPCTSQCVLGCFCANGYIRKGKTCVPTSQCRRTRERPSGPPQGIGPRSYGYGPPLSSYSPAFPPRLPPALPPPPAFPPAFPPSFPPAFSPSFSPAFSPPFSPPFPPPPPPPFQGYPPFPGYASPPLSAPRPLPPAFPPPLPPKFPPALPPLPPPLPPALPPKHPPLPAPLPPALPPKVPPSPVPDGRGCPDRNKCNKYCRSVGHKVGFCVDANFMKCNCLS